MTLRLVLVALAAALLAPPAEAGAQTRTVVVPAGAEVVVPPRGSALPRPAPRPASQRPRLPPLPPAGGSAGRLDLGGAGSVAGVLLPAIAAAAVAAVLSDGGGGAAGNRTTSGPARTR